MLQTLEDKSKGKKQLKTFDNYEQRAEKLKTILKEICEA